MSLYTFHSSQHRTAGTHVQVAVSASAGEEDSHFSARARIGTRGGARVAFFSLLLVALSVGMLLVDIVDTKIGLVLPHETANTSDVTWRRHTRQGGGTSYPRQQHTHQGRTQQWCVAQLIRNPPRTNAYVESHRSDESSHTQEVSSRAHSHVRGPPHLCSSMSLRRGRAGFLS